jgi:hypothetical protein
MSKPPPALAGTKGPPRARTNTSQSRTSNLDNGGPEDIFTSSQPQARPNAIETTPQPHTNPTTGAATRAMPSTPRRHGPNGNYGPNNSGLGRTSDLFSSPSKLTPRQRTMQTTSAASHLANVRGHLQATRARYADRQPRQHILPGTILIAENDWDALATMIDQLGTLVQRDARLTDTVASLATNLASLQASLDARLTTLEENISDALVSPSPEPSYAQAVKSGRSAPAPASSMPELPNRRSGRNPDLELTLIQANPTQPVFASSQFPELKNNIDRILTECGIESAAGRPLAIRTVSRHPSKDLIISLHSKEDAAILRARANQWIPKLSPQLSLRITLYPVICHRVPTSFDPSSPEAIAELKTAAAGQLDSLTKVVWANPKKVHPDQGPSKTTSSIIIYPADPVQANNIIRYGLPLRATLHPAEKSRRSLIQCHNCQHFGHTAARCSARPACGRCAAPHNTTSCVCPETPPCEDHRACTHVTLCCALCGLPHRASFRECPSRLNALTKLSDLGHHDDEFYPLPST